MNSLQRAGGLASLAAAAAFVVGFVVYVAVLGPAQYGSAAIEPVRHAAFLAQNQLLLTLWNLVIYVAFGTCLVVLTLALHERLRPKAAGLAAVGAAFGLIWSGLVIAAGMVANVGMGVIVELFAADPARAAAVWLTYKFVVGGLGGGNEIVGGLWLVLVSLAAFRTRALPRSLAVLGGVVGSAGLLTTAPPLAELGSVFGLGLIVWFAWTGLVLLRGKSLVAAAELRPAAA